MGRLGWLILIVVVYALHQDVWFWSTARPLVFGFLPIGLAYHAAYCVAVAAMMWALTRFAWPGRLERDLQPGGDEGARRPGRREGSPR